jgi:hypothetical protein
VLEAVMERFVPKLLLELPAPADMARAEHDSRDAQIVEQVDSVFEVMPGAIRVWERKPYERRNPRGTQILRYV